MVFTITPVTLEFSNSAMVARSLSVSIGLFL